MSIYIRVIIKWLLKDLNFSLKDDYSKSVGKFKQNRSNKIEKKANRILLK